MENNDLKKFVFVQNFGKYDKKVVTIWAKDQNDAWILLGKEVKHSTDYLLTKN